jgi:hypothetical protein
MGLTGPRYLSKETHHDSREFVLLVGVNVMTGILIA